MAARSACWCTATGAGSCWSTGSTTRTPAPPPCPCRSTTPERWARLLGGSRVTESIGAVQHEIAGLSIEWIVVADGAPAIGSSLGEGAYRTHTGASIVAVMRADQPIPAPDQSFVLEAADVAVAVGTVEGLESLRRLLTAPA